MFLTENQIWVFMLCFSLGVIFGFFLSVLGILTKKLVNGVFACFLYVFSFIIFSFLFVYFNFRLFFPNYRLYMVFGIAFGSVSSAKSFDIILAKLAEKFYNKTKVKQRNKNNERVEI